jgi:hypothetical protein
MPPILTPEERARYDLNGCLLLKGFFNAEDTHDIRKWVNSLETWCPPTPEEQVDGRHYTFHYETLKDGDGGGGARPALCRIENFTPWHGGLESVALERLAPLCSELLGEEATLFKEKLNIKPGSGGKGYAPHYDGPSAAALNLAKTFITVQVAVDEQTVSNGCMQVVVPRSAWPTSRDMLPPTSDDPDRGGRIGAIPDDVADGLEWEPIECSPGDVLVFDHWLPHKSGFNRTTSSRRTLYMLFNPLREGDFHAQYYALFAQMRAAAAAARKGGEGKEKGEEEGKSIAEE